jgi:hypothetical protein
MMMEWKKVTLFLEVGVNIVQFNALKMVGGGEEFETAEWTFFCLKKWNLGVRKIKLQIVYMPFTNSFK